MLPLHAQDVFSRDSWVCCCKQDIYVYFIYLLMKMNLVFNLCEKRVYNLKKIFKESVHSTFDKIHFTDSILWSARWKESIPHFDSFGSLLWVLSDYLSDIHPMFLIAPCSEGLYSHLLFVTFLALNCQKFFSSRFVQMANRLPFGSFVIWLVNHHCCEGCF